MCLGKMYVKWGASSQPSEQYQLYYYGLYRNNNDGFCSNFFIYAVRSLPRSARTLVYQFLVMNSYYAQSRSSSAWSSSSNFFMMIMKTMNMIKSCSVEYPSLNFRLGWLNGKKLNHDWNQCSLLFLFLGLPDFVRYGIILNFCSNKVIPKRGRKQNGKHFLRELYLMWFD